MRKVKKTIVLFACILVLLSTTAYAQSANTYSTSREILQFWYNGYVQVQPGYVIPDNPGYLLDNYVGKNICQGGFWYNVNGKIKGETYTRMATSKNDFNIYSSEATVTDTLNPTAPQTLFYRAWSAFD